MTVEPCPTDDKGWWAYSRETDRLIEANGRIVDSWRAFLPWNMFVRVPRNFKVVDARLAEAGKALDNEIDRLEAS